MRPVIFKNIILIVLILFVYIFIYQIELPSNNSDRDDAVTISVEAFKRGENPFLELTHLGNQITTGISSILLGLVLSIKHLSFLFWLLIITLLYKDDHGGFVYLGIFIIASHVVAFTLVLHLDELYFGILFIWLAYLSYNNRPFVAGLLLSLAFTNRTVYMPLIFPMIIWYNKAIWGFLAGIFIQASIFLIVVGESIIYNNSYITSFNIDVPAQFIRLPLDYSLLFILPGIILINHYWIKIAAYLRKNIWNKAWG